MRVSPAHGALVVLSCSLATSAAAQDESSPPSEVETGTAEDEPATFETVVRAASPTRSASTIRMSQEELLTLPGTVGDPLRAVETLVGAAPVAPLLPYYPIRGAPPSGTGFFIDGMPVPGVFHIAFGPSVIPPQLLGGIEIHVGGAPISYGRRVGGVVAASMDRSRVERFGVWWNLSDVDASLGGQVRLTEDLDVALSGRYSYAGPIVHLVSPEIDVVYGDYQARMRWSPTAADELTLLALGSVDEAPQMPTELLASPLSSTFHRVLLRWEREWSPRLRSDWVGWFGYDQSDFGETGVSAWSGGPRFEVDWRPTAILGFRAGLDVEGRGYPAPDLPAPGFFPDPSEEAFDLAIRERDAVLAGAWAELRIEPSAATRIVVGLRGDVHAVDESTNWWWDARVSLRRRINRWLALVATAGTYHQPQSFIIELPGFASFALDRPPQSSFQIAQGVEVGLPWRLRFQLQGFYSSFRNLSEVEGRGTWPNREEEITDVDRVFPNLSGRAYGLEVLLRRRISDDLHGWIAYTLARSERDYESGPAPPFTDRTHVLNVVLSWHIAQGWRVGARFQVRSGRPFTPETASSPVGGPRASGRLPPYLQLDLRLDKAWTIGALRIAAYLEIVNVTFSQDATGMDYQWWGCESDDGCPEPELLPPLFVPLLGVRGEY